MQQPTLFGGKNKQKGAARAEDIVLFALGDFQSRKKVLAGRELALDRLRGALRRAAASLGEEELSDTEAVTALRALGVTVLQVPSFVAKHPFRVTVPAAVAERARNYYVEALKSVENGS